MLVEPDTQVIIVDLPAAYGKLTRRSHDLQKHIAAAKRQNSGWQTAWKKSEKTLEAQKSADKTPPRIRIDAPSYPDGKGVVRLDSYQTYIRGTAEDNEGVLQVLINGKKTS